MEKWMGTNALYYPKLKISCQGSNYSETRFSKWSFSKSLSEHDGGCLLYPIKTHFIYVLIQFMLKNQKGLNVLMKRFCSLTLMLSVVITLK